MHARAAGGIVDDTPAPAADAHLAAAAAAAAIPVASAATNATVTTAAAATDSCRMALAALGRLWEQHWCDLQWT